MTISVEPRSPRLDAQRAGRQSGALFLLSGVLALAVVPSIPGRTNVLVAISCVDLVIAVVVLMVPWQRWPVGVTAVLAIPAWVMIGLATWALGGFGTGAGTFFVLGFAWLGLHHTRRTILAQSPLAAAAYVGALLATGAPRNVLTTAALLIPISVTVGLIIEGRVRRLKQARVLLEEEQRWRAALMATLAHDVRSPLTTIHGALEIIADDEGLPEHLVSLVAAATRQTARLTALASNLLDLERVEGGKLILDLQWLDLTELAELVAELLGSGDVTVDVDPGLTIHADALRLQQMLVNLGTNAQSHGAPPIVIGARSTTAGVEISVRDHGDGVPAEDRPSLFQRLNRTEGNPESVGLGLWIVRLLAQAHGGDATYRPANPGSEFVITLPTNVSAPAEPSIDALSGR